MVVRETRRATSLETVLRVAEEISARTLFVQSDRNMESLVFELNLKSLYGSS